MNIHEEFNEYRQQLDLWMQSLGLLNCKPPENDCVEQILSMDRTALAERETIKLGQDAFILSQYALFLEMKSNECKGFLKWAAYTSPKLDQNDRPLLFQWTKKAELRLERIQYLTKRIESMIQALGNIIRIRKNV